MSTPKQLEEKFRTITSAWQSLRPGKSFAGMALGEFKVKAEPSLVARTRIAEVQNQLIAAVSSRDAADKITSQAVSNVVNAVKADLNEGDDGELYEAMGYVRKSERKAGGRKKILAPTASATVFKQAA